MAVAFTLPLGTLLLGLAAGFLFGRRVNTWCPRCGETTECPECGPFAVTGRRRSDVEPSK
jgi:hypothetical protein